MTDRVEELRRERDRHVVLLQHVLKEFAKNQSAVFMFFEGKDADYYRPRVYSIFYSDTNINIQNCKGKHVLRPLRKSVRGNAFLRHIRAAFFFDRDYETATEEFEADDIFITDGYSIENYYVKPVVIERILKSIVFLDLELVESEESWLKSIIERFKEMRRYYLEAASLFNYWARAQRTTGRSGRINLDDFVISKYMLFDFPQNKVTAHYDLDALNLLTPERKPVEFDEIENQKPWFKERDASRAYRGKQEIHCIYLFLTHVFNDLIDEKSGLGRRVKITKRVSLKEAVFDLSTYAETTECLIKFLLARKSVWSQSLPAS